MIVVDRKKEIKDYKDKDSAASRYNYKNDKGYKRKDRKSKERKNTKSKRVNLNKSTKRRKKRRKYLRKNKRTHNENHRKDSNNNQADSKESWFNRTFIYMISYALLIGIIAIFGILYINKYVEMSKINSRITQVQNRIENLKTNKRKAKLKIAQHKSLDRIERIAKNDLGMVEPDKVNFISMQKVDGVNKKSNEMNELKTRFNKLNELGYKISTWFKGLTQVEAGTLDK
ncbi:cell division protein FtsL [Candidatus Frackibacter sp. WG12]|uniref:septum formation initiator family protein n=1 Tax=unclassified Candidatus Frackibacter TaxID=2648818 RepID=UPI00088E7D9D|nr:MULTISPECIES: septum formation initiator family protein [unclassified Candidatus Frackibacter]SDC35247.1 cell division protein FtsL [Candidatus Frackibacter sp. WG11]SEM56171.1 cell division protein FtsL [Candidatus Frackibacter sp. WG12]